MRGAGRISARAACAASLAALALLSAPAAHAGERKVPPGFVGVMWDKEIQDAPPELQSEQWRAMALNGVESARVVFSWNLAQEEASFKPNFVRADQMVRNAAVHGIEVMPVITYAPPWARVEPDNLGSAPRDLRAYGHYVSELVRRYGPRGYYWRRNPEVPRRPIRTWQIWNEPHLEYQFAPHADWPRRYARVLRAGSRAIRSRDRRATVVLAGFANDAWAEIGRLYRAGNVRRYFDAAAVHMYSATPSDFVEVTRRFRRAMDRGGDRRKPIYITEVGASASADAVRSPGHEYFQTTRRQMAQLISPTIRALAGVRRRYKIAGVYWYTWASPYGVATGVFGYTGLNAFDRISVDPQPALAAFRSTAYRYEGCRKDARARCVR